MLLSFYAVGQNEYLITVEKTTYSKDKYLYSNQEFFLDKNLFRNKDEVTAIGVYYKKLDLKKAKTDTSALKDVLLSRPDVSVGILNGNGVFKLPPVYTLFSTGTAYGIMLAQRLRSGLWKITLYYEGHNTWKTLPPQPDFNNINAYFLLYKANNGKYGLYSRLGKEILPAVFDSVEFLTPTLEVKKVKSDYKSLEACFKSGMISINPYADKPANDVAYIRFRNQDSTVWVNQRSKILRNMDEVYDDSGMREMIKKAYADSVEEVKKTQLRQQAYENDIRIRNENEAKNKRIRDLEANPANFTGKVSGSYKDIKLTINGIEYVSTGSSSDELMGVHTKDFNVVTIGLTFKCTSKSSGMDAYIYELDAELSVREGRFTDSGKGMSNRVVDGYIFPESTDPTAKEAKKLRSMSGHFNPATAEIVLEAVGIDGHRVLIRATRNYQYKY
jgi:hypothetical protein